MALLAVCKVMLASLLGAVCIKGECESPPVIQNAYNNLTGTPPYSQNITVRYDCELGYNPVGTSRFYSCFGTTWTNGNFRCEQIYCPHVETPENGRLENTPTYKVGTIIQFACNEGHAMSGQNKMQCRRDGGWLPSTPPTCTAMDCGEFGSIQDADLFQNSSYTERNHYGSVIQVTCLNGTTLIGSTQVKCQANGEWGLKPTCEDVQCPPYPNTDSPCISELQTFGVYLFINCTEDIATHFGPKYAECIKGQWDTTEMGCLCDCIIPEYNSSTLTLNGLNSHGNLPHATALEWTCHGTSVKSSSKFVMCLDGKFNIQDDQDNDMIYTNPSDFTRIILPQLCYSPTLLSSSSSSLSSPPSTTTSTTLSSSSSSTKTSLISILTTGLRMTQTTTMTMVSVSFPTTVSSSEMSIRKSLPNSTTAYSTMSARVTVSSQSVTRSSTLSSPETISFQSMTSSSITPSSIMSTSLTVSSKSTTPSSTMSTSLTVSSKSITPSQSITPSSTMSTSNTLIPVTISTQSTTLPSTMSTQVTVSSLSTTPFTISSSFTLPSQSITPSSTMSTPVTVSSQSITPSSTMSTPVTASSQSITPSSTMSTPVTVSSQSITPSSSLPTPVTVSSHSITPSSTMSTSNSLIPVTILTQSTTLPSTMSTQETASSLSTTPFTISSSFTLPSQSIPLSSTMQSLNEISLRSITPSSSISIQDTKMLKEITSSCTMPSSVTVLSKSVTSSFLISPQVPLMSKIISSSSKTLPSTMTSKITTVPVYSASSSISTPLTDAATTTGTYVEQNNTLFNAKVTNAMSRGQMNVTASTDNESKDYINSGTIHFDLFVGSNICCIFLIFNIL